MSLLPFQKNHKILKAARIALCIFVALSIAATFKGMYTQVASTPEHIDEIAHIHSTFYYKLFFIDKDFSNADWSTKLAYDQPPVAKYILGFSLHMFDGKIIQTVNGLRHVHNTGTSEMIIPGLQVLTRDSSTTRVDELLAYAESMLTVDAGDADTVSEKQFLIARMTIFFFSVLTVVMLIVVSTHVTRNLLAGLLSGLLFVTSPIITPGFQQIFTDPIWCLFSLVSLYFLLRFFKAVQDGHMKKALMCGFGAGICIALAVGTKLIAVYAVVAVVAMTIAVLIRIVLNKKTSTTFTRSLTPIHKPLLSVLLVGVVSILTFIIMNPFLYHNTPHNIFVLFEHRSIIMETQALVLSPVIESLSERIVAITQHGVLMGHAKTAPMVALLLIMYALGTWTFFRKSIHEWKEESVGPYSLFFIWALSALLLIGVTVTLEWERYFLPVALCSALFIAVGVVSFVRWVYIVALKLFSSKN